MRGCIEARSRALVVLLTVLFTFLNVLAVYAAGRFRSMANRAMERESYFVGKHKVEQMHRLFWGYYAGLVVVLLDELAVLSVAVWRLNYTWYM